jgi:exosortase D (VPLPA-CTERM-specific)
MLPPPGFVYRSLTFPLQIFSSDWSVKLLHMMDISAYREGNVIDLDFMVLQVLDACNGLRYILPLLTAGVLFAYFGHKVWWKRILLIVATVPIAIFANIVRIAGTGFIGMYWGEESARGFFHSFSGWAVFMSSVGVFFLFNALVRLIPSRPREEKPAPTPSTDSPSRRRISWTAAATAVALLLVTPPVVSYLGHVPPVPLAKALGEFPLDFKGWTGQRELMAPEFWEKVGGQRYVIIDFRKDRHLPLNFYVAYYEYQRKAGDFVQSPRLCLPGAGWEMEQNHVRNIQKNRASGANDELKLNELVINKAGRKQVAYFWYQGRGRQFTSEWAAKFYMVWDGIFRRRTDGALVRLMMPLDSSTTVEKARSILDPFALAAAQALEEYLP